MNTLKEVSIYKTPRGGTIYFIDIEYPFVREYLNSIDIEYHEFPTKLYIVVIFLLS